MWALIHRTQGSAGSWKVNDTVQDMIRNLSSNDMMALARYKKILLRDSWGAGLEETILQLENECSEKLAYLVADLGEYFQTSLYFIRSRVRPTERDWIQVKLQNQSREETFEHLFSILDPYSEDLSKEYTVNLERL